MSLDALLQTLRRDAEAEREAVLAAARQEADALSAASAAQARSVMEGRVAAGRARHSAEAERQAAARVREVRGAELRAREQLLDRVFGAARDALPVAGAGDGYRAAVARRLPRALADAGGAPVEVLCAPSLAASLPGLAALPPDSRWRADPGIAAGLRVRTLDGAMEVDDTLEGHLERRRAELARGVLADLCGGAA